MTVRRIKDPAGLLPDHLTVAPGQDVAGDFAALAEMMDASSPARRIAALRRHGGLIEFADELAMRLSGPKKQDADMRLLHDIAQAEHRALYLDAAPSVRRDMARQAGTRTPRRPEITRWIAAQLQRDPHAKSPDLWRRAPDWITDDIGERRFAARVTACRKSRASK